MISTENRLNINVVFCIIAVISFCYSFYFIGWLLIILLIINLAMILKNIKKRG
jgi:Na+/H+ antiporter NhaB